MGSGNKGLAAPGIANDTIGSILNAAVRPPQSSDPGGAVHQSTGNAASAQQAARIHCSASNPGG